MKNRKTGMLIALLLVSVVLFSGCAGQQQQQAIGSQEEVQQVVTNVTENIGDIQETLEDIDQTFG